MVAYAHALSIDPSSLDSLLGCAALLKSANQIEEALNLLEQAYTIAPKNTDISLALAITLTDLGTFLKLSSSPLTTKAAACASNSSNSSSSTSIFDTSEQHNKNNNIDSNKSQQKLKQQLWKDYYQRAAKVCPSYAPAHYNLGVAATEQGDMEGAVAGYQEAIRFQPTYTEAWCNLGVLYKTQGRLVDAIDAYEKAHAVAPDNELVSVNLAAALTEQATLMKDVSGYSTGGDGNGTSSSNNSSSNTSSNGKNNDGSNGTNKTMSSRPASHETQSKEENKNRSLFKAISIYERALAIHPKSVETLYNLAVALTEAGHKDRAIFMYEITITLAPHCAEAHNNLGVLYRERANPEKAAQCYAAALSVRSNFPEALNNLAVLHTQAGRAREALGLLQAALLASPKYSEAYNNLGVLHREVGSVLEAIEAYDMCLTYEPDDRNGGQNRLLALNYVHHGDSEEVCSAHVEWGRRFEKLYAPLVVQKHEHKQDQEQTAPRYCYPSMSRNDARFWSEDRPLIVGYVSPDLFTHSVSYFAEAPLSHHNNPDRVKHIVYSCCIREDGKTEHLKKRVRACGGEWKDVVSLSEQALAELVMYDQVDILVELTGHTAHNRLGTMAMKPAPIQVTWIGYPNSTGLTTIDYRLTDAICDPPNSDTTQTFTEQLVRLPHCFLCYTPALDAPAVAPAPVTRNGFITFGSFNALAKQTPEVLTTWGRLLLAVPNSRLVLKNKPFACEWTKAKYWAFFEDMGVERNRVDLLPLAPANADHLGQYSLIDIGLDPWPYAGTTTTTEALWMGVPVLTLAGKCHAHNVGISLLTAVGLHKEEEEGGYVAGSVEEYVERGVALACDVEGLVHLRGELRERMAESYLCDAPGFTERLEDVYRRMWKRWVREGRSMGGDELTDWGWE
jgi:protein O-GlcNAc transferase